MESTDQIIFKIQKLTQIRLKKGYTTSPTVETKFLTNDYVPVDQLERHVSQWRSIHVGKKPSEDWGTVGVIDRVKLQKKFSVARITNMCGFHFHLFIFGKANTQDIQVGRVIGIFKPTIVFSSDLKASVALSVKDKAQLLLIGESQDLIQCTQWVRKDKQCPTMLDGRSGTLCDVHITKACKASKNTRMELASGDSGLDVRWAKVSEKGYEATQFERKLDKEYTYIFKGRGPITSDGTELHVKNPKTHAEDAKEKEALAEFLKGKNDVGAEMLRRARGIKEEKRASNALSKEAMLKMGYSNTQVLTKDESDAKRKAIDELLEMNGAGASNSKKPRYVYL